MCVCVFVPKKQLLPGSSKSEAVTSSASEGCSSRSSLLGAAAGQEVAVWFYHDGGQQLLHVDRRGGGAADGAGGGGAAVAAAAQVVHQLREDGRQFGAFVGAPGGALRWRGVHLLRVGVSQTRRVLQQSSHAGRLSQEEKNPC